MSAVTAPGIVLDQSGPATAKPGDVLTYNIMVTNTGKGPALSAVLGETSPDGSVQTSGRRYRRRRGAGTEVDGLHCAGDGVPGQLTGASATLSFKDFVGKPLSVTDVTALQILDVAPPTLSRDTVAQSFVAAESQDGDSGCDD